MHAVLTPARNWYASWVVLANLTRKAKRLDSRLRKLLVQARAVIRDDGFDRSDFGSWRPLIREFLGFVSRPLLNALSQSYQQGTRLNDIVKDTASAFKKELAVDGDPIAALDRLSEEDSIRLLTIHKCKELEFEKVVVMGVETQLFFGSAPVVKSEFFVAISRAKDELVVTHAEHRSRPVDAPTRGSEQRTAYAELLEYAEEL